MIRGFLRDKSCLFIGSPNCTNSNQCLAHLESIGLVVTVIWSTRRGEEIPIEAKNWQGDFIFSYRNYWLLPKSIFNTAKIMAINFHPATPDYPGSGSYSWAIYENSPEFGVTVHLMNEKFDNGKILAVYKFDIEKDSTLQNLINTAQEFSVFAFKKFIDELNDSSDTEIAKMKELPSEFKWRGRAKTISDLDKMRSIDISMIKTETERRIRAFHMEKYPVYLELNGRKFYYVSDGQ
jgi:methionyl-tRNA formyltransferase